MLSRHFIEIRLIEYGSGEVLWKSKAQLSNEEEIRRLFDNARLRGLLLDVHYAEEQSEELRKTLFEE